MTRVLVVLVALFFLTPGAQANLTINRYINASNVSVPVGDDTVSTLNWTNNGFTNLNSVSVQMVLSSDPDNPFFVGDTEATLTYNIGNTNNQVLGAVIYGLNPGDESPSLNQVFVVTNSFTSPGVNNEWSVDLFNDDNNVGPAIFNYWRLILTGGAVTNGTIEAGAQGIISGTDGYTVTATISAGSGTGSNAVTAFVTNNQSLHFNGGVTGSGELAKTGGGTLTIGGASSGFTGTLNVEQGTAALTGAGTLATGTSINLSGSSSVFDISGMTAAGSTNGSLAGVSGSSVVLGGKHLTIGGNNANTSFAGVISGSGGSFTKTGTGTLTLSGANTFTGALTVAEGKLNISTINNANAAGVLGNSTNAVVLGSSGQTGFLHYIGTANASSDKTFTAASGGTAGIEVSNAATTLTLSGAIGGSGNVQKGGAGILHLSGNNTFGGTLSVHDGTLQIGAINNANTAGALGNSANAVEIGKTNTSNTSTLLYTGGTASSTKAFTLMSETNAAAVFNVSNAATALTLSGAIGGGGRLEKSGAGTLVLSASNNYSGGTTLSAGTLRVNQTHALGSGHLSQSSGSSLLQIGTTGTIANSMSLYNVQFSANATLTGAKTLNNATYTVDSGITATEQGVLSGSGGLTKSGAGALVLHGSANNTYTGATVVNAGSLVLSNSSGNAINNSSSITVNSGGTLVLGASNQIGNSIGLVLNGGTFLLGASGVTETLGTLTLSADSTIDFGNYGASGLRQLTFASSAGVSWATNATLTIANWQGVINTSSDFTEIFFGVGGLTSAQQGQIRFANQGNVPGTLLGSGELVPVPEPRVYAAAVALLAAVGWRERRRLVGFLRRR